MALDDDIAILARVAPFHTFTTDQLRLLAFGAEPLSLPAGHWLCRSGQVADGGFILAEGSLAAMDDNGRPTARHSAPGTLIGETALIIRTQWTISLAAETDARLLRLPRPLFRRILEEYPETAEAIRNALCVDIAAKVALMERHAGKFA
ncbi:MAG: cyclic nucleotide-binding domain-containing protein [Phyllobacteriaceae bacterium]|nr:cyclic nucleotide-binding domain-containing protein [Phyllobacteriaceae bacterium]